MVSCTGELFRRNVSDETIGTQTKAIASRWVSGERPSGLLAGGRKQISAASDGADYRGFGRIDLDFAPDSHDPQVHGAIEGLGVTRVGQFQQPLARQHPLRIGRENLEQAEFGSGQRMLIALVVARSEEHTSELQSLAYLVCRL